MRRTVCFAFALLAMLLLSGCAEDPAGPDVRGMTLPDAKTTLAEGDYSAHGGDPDVSAGEFGEDVKGSAAVLGRGG